MKEGERKGYNRKVEMNILANVSSILYYETSKSPKVSYIMKQQEYIQQDL